jgi:O-antigen ligase
VPELAVTLLLTALGLPLLVGLARRGPVAPAARALVVFLAVGLISALISKSPLVGIFGLYTWGTGWMLWCTVASTFAIGATLSAAGRRRVGDALIAAAALDAIVAVLQVGFEIHTGVLALYNGTQADGLLGNPVYLQALLLGSLALVGWRCCTEDARWAMLPPVLGAGLQLSRERLAIALVALLAIALVARFRSLAALAAAGATLGGYLAAWVTSGVLSRGSVSGAVDVGNTPRLLAWKLFLRSIIDHPFLGVGPGETRTAFMRLETLVDLRRIGQGNVFTDAHDFVLEIGVTTGLLGVVALAVFVAFVIRAGAGGGFAWSGLAILAVAAVEPLNIVTIPLAALAFGAALPSMTTPSESARRGSVPRYVAQAALNVVALLACVALVTGDYEYGVGSRGFDLAEVRTASRIMPIWADTATAVATVDELRADTSGPARLWFQRARQTEVEATRRDPGDPELWTSLGATELALGDVAAAQSDYEQAHDLYPWWTLALMGLGTATQRVISCDAAAHWFELADQSDPGDAAAAEALQRCRLQSTTASAK